MAGGFVHKTIALLAQDLVRQKDHLVIRDHKPVPGYFFEGGHHVGVELPVISQKLIQVTLKLGDSHGGIPPLARNQH